VPDEEFWENTLSTGVLHRAAPLQSLAGKELTPALVELRRRRRPIRNILSC